MSQIIIRIFIIYFFPRLLHVNKIGWSLFLQCFQMVWSSWFSFWFFGWCGNFGRVYIFPECNNLYSMNYPWMVNSWSLQNKIVFYILVWHYRNLCPIISMVESQGCHLGTWSLSLDFFNFKNRPDSLDIANESRSNPRLSLFRVNRQSMNLQMIILDMRSDHVNK